jgi:hypothetical protein
LPQQKDSAKFIAVELIGQLFRWRSRRIQVRCSDGLQFESGIERSEPFVKPIPSPIFDFCAIGRNCREASIMTFPTS